MMPFLPRPPTPSLMKPHGLSKAHVIELAGLTFIPDLSGALFAPDRKALFIADLHLEQGAALARRGIAVPPYDTMATLAALELVIAATMATQLYLLGDSFHDAQGHVQLEPAVADRLRRITGRVETVWISGNHDPMPKSGLGGVCAAEVLLTAGQSAIALRHEPRRRLGSSYEIAGHLHPGAGVVQRGHMVRAKCFVSDARRVILPAFGAYTGALPVTSPAFAGLFEREKASIHMLAREKIYKFPMGRVS
jgi:uncharacterized protein